MAEQSSDNPLQETLLITNRMGIHARAAAMISEAAAKARGGVWIIYGNTHADAVNMLDVMSMAVGLGERITVMVEQAGDAHILRRITEMVKNGFGE